jgi:hypothetical protein
MAKAATPPTTMATMAATNRMRLRAGWVEGT